MEVQSLGERNQSQGGKENMSHKFLTLANEVASSEE
jgi:hypothetical protein